jgi:hypothetical protein
MAFGFFYAVSYGTNAISVRLKARNLRLELEQNLTFFKGFTAEATAC